MKTKWKFMELYSRPKNYILINIITRKKKKIFIHDFEEYIRELELRNNYTIKEKDKFKKVIIEPKETDSKVKTKKSIFNFLRKDK